MVKLEEGTSANSQAQSAEFFQLADQLAELGRHFYHRGWALGTSGNFSAVISRDPIRLAITHTGLDKGALTANHFLQVGEDGKPIDGVGRPSDETMLHLAVVRLRGAGSVLHTHSVWSTLVSETCATEGGVAIEGFEMLKGLKHVRTHEHREWLPIIDNSQDYEWLERSLEASLKRHTDAHGVLLRGHGLYTWGQTVAEGKRHVEILEFLLEVVGRRLANPS